MTTRSERATLAARAGDDDLWSSYQRVVVRHDRDDGAFEVHPAPAGTAEGGFPGDAAGGTVAIITAWNPAGVARPLAANRAAHHHLVSALRHWPEPAPELRWWPARGADPEDTWAEEGLAIVGLDRAQAGTLALTFGQVAWYEWSPTALVLLATATHRASVLGWRRQPVAVDVSGQAGDRSRERTAGPSWP